MVDLVTDRGYPATSVADIVRLAGVGRSVFYDNFASRVECLAATYDSIVGGMIDAAVAGYRTPGTWRERLGAALLAVCEQIEARPQAARFVMVDAPAAGPPARVCRQHALAEVAELARAAFAEAPANVVLPEILVRAVLGGGRFIVNRYVRERRANELTGLVDDYLEWALGYASRATAALAELPDIEMWMHRPPDRPAPIGVVPQLLGPLGAQPFVVPTARERIVDAVSTIAFEQGYAALGVAAIARRARVGHKTYTEMFSSTQEAFIASLDVIARDFIANIVQNFDPSRPWPEALHATITAVGQYLVRNPKIVRLGVLEVPMAGEVGLMQRDSVVQAAMAFLALGAGFDDRYHPPAITVEAVASAVMELLDYIVEHDVIHELPRFTPYVSYLALAPFIGPKRAISVALHPPAD